MIEGTDERIEWCVSGGTHGWIRWKKSMIEGTSEGMIIYIYIYIYQYIYTYIYNIKRRVRVKEKMMRLGERRV